MAEKELVIRITFSEEQDEFDEDYTQLDFLRMKVDEALTDLTEDQRNQLSESWGQSDWYSVGFVNALVHMLYSNTTVEAKDVRTY